MSLKPEHSEGPWTYAPWANEDGRWCVSQCGTEALAIAVTFGQPNAEVDARLMAKAPQLLSSARAALADLERALDKLGAMGHGMDWDSVHELRQVLSLIDDAPRKGTEEAEAPDWRRKPAYSQETVRAVSEGFVDKIRKALTAEKWADLCRLNAKESSPEVCHSHDFLDANIFMYEAIEEFAPDVPFWDPEGGGPTDLATALWNDAWDLAKREHMTRSPGPGRRFRSVRRPSSMPAPGPERTDMNLEPMWEALERYQEHAEKHGFGPAWKRMTTERTEKAALAAVEAATLAAKAEYAAALPAWVEYETVSAVFAAEASLVRQAALAALAASWGGREVYWRDRAITVITLAIELENARDASPRP